MTKKLFLLFSVGLFIFFMGCSQDQKSQKKVNKLEKNKQFVLKIGYLEYPPLTYTNKQGLPDGKFIDLAKKTLNHAGIKYSIQGYPANRLYKYLQDGQAHLFLGIKTISKLQGHSISGKSMIGSLEMRVYSIGKKPKIEKRTDLKGKKVIILRGFAYADWGAWIRNPKNGVNFVETNSHEAAFEMLKRKRADYLLNYKYIARFVLKNKKIDNLFYKKLFNWECYFVLSNKTPKQKEILQKMDKSYQYLIKNKLLEQLD